MPTKVCDACGETKPLSAFSKQRKRCKPCQSKYQASIRASSPEQFLFSRALNRRASELTKSDLRDLWDSQDGKCAVTGLHMTYKPKSLRESTGLNASVDRIDSRLGYTKANSRLVCHRVNYMRGAGEDADLLWWCKQIVSGLEKQDE